MPKRCIKLFSFVGDIVLDPFSGSGTTIIEAIQNKRNAIGIEISEEYKKLSEQRIHKEFGGQATVENGQTLCAQHNFQKKTLKQTETGKKCL